MSLKCPKCGEDNPKSNRFCDSCGTKLAVDADVKPAPAAVKPARKPAEAPAAAAAPAATGGWSLPFDKDVLWMILIVAFGAFLRLWALGDKPLHHDESIHAWYSLKLFTDGGGAYKYDPAYHGPFLYHANALMYFIFGTSDFACRILPAIFGIVMIAFMWAWRPLLGRTGSLMAALLIAVSPTMAYVSRFIRDDIYMALGTMALVWGVFRWFDDRKPKYLYWGAAGFTVSFLSMEATWIFGGIFASFLAARWLWEKLDDSAGEQQLHELLAYLFPKPQRGTGLGLAASAGALAGGLVLYMGLNRAVDAGSPLLTLMHLVSVAGGLGLLFFGGRYLWETGNKTLGILLAIFFVPFTILFTSMFYNADGWFVGMFDSLAYWLGEQKTGRADQPWFFYFGLLALYELGIVVFALVGGLRIFFGSGRAQFFILKLLGLAPLFISFFILVNDPKNPGLLIVMAGLATLGISMISFCAFEPGRENMFKVFLLHWAILATVMFSLAGERMPWLTLHPLTPMALLAGLYLGEMLERDKPMLFEHWIGWAVLWIPVAVLAVLGPVTMAYGFKQAPAELSSWLNSLLAKERHGAFAPSGWNINLWDSTVLRLLPAALFVLLLACTPFILSRWPKLKEHSRKIWIGFIVLAVVALLHGTNNLLFYGDGANPAEQAVYVQSSTEIPKLQKRLTDMSNVLTGGMEMKIAVEDTCSWPLSWYLRDFKQAVVGYRPPITLDQIKAPQPAAKPGEPMQPWPMTEYPPVIISAFDNNPPQRVDHDATVSGSLAGYYEPNRMKLRVWWGPNRDAVLGDVSFTEMMGKFMRLYVYREPWPAPNQGRDNFGNTSPIGSFDMCVWVRKDLEKYYW